MKEKPTFGTLLEWRRKKDGQIKGLKEVEEFVMHKLKREFRELEDLNRQIENYN